MQFNLHHKCTAFNLHLYCISFKGNDCCFPVKLKKMTDKCLNIMYLNMLGKKENINTVALSFFISLIGYPVGPKRTHLVLHNGLV